MRIVRGKHILKAAGHDLAGRNAEISAFRRKLTRKHGPGVLSGDYSPFTGEYAWVWTVDSEELGGERPLQPGAKKRSRRPS